MGFERCHPAVNLIYFTAVIGVRCASGTRCIWPFLFAPPSCTA